MNRTLVSGEIPNTLVSLAPPSVSASLELEGGASLQCHRCQTVLTTVVVCRGTSRTAYCIQAPTRLRRVLGPRDTLLPDIISVELEDLHSRLASLRSRAFLPDHIPRSTRGLVAAALTVVLTKVTNENSLAAWTTLMTSGFTILGRVVHPLIDSNSLFLKSLDEIYKKIALPDLMPRFTLLPENRLPKEFSPQESLLSYKMEMFLVLLKLLSSNEAMLAPSDAV